jgi:hypothetical protein
LNLIPDPERLSEGPLRKWPHRQIQDGACGARPGRIQQSGQSAAAATHLRSSQRKEQIMRSVTFTLAAAFVAAAAQFSTAGAQTASAPSPSTDVPQAQRSQTGVPQARPSQTADPQPQRPQSVAPQSPDQANADSIPNQKLDATAAAMQRIASLRRDYMQLLEDAAPDDKSRIADEASDALKKAVTDQGLSVEEYTVIVEAAQFDPQVRQKIMERMQPSEK